MSTAPATEAASPFPVGSASSRQTGSILPDASQKSTSSKAGATKLPWAQTRRTLLPPTGTKRNPTTLASPPPRRSTRTASPTDAFPAAETVHRATNALPELTAAARYTAVPAPSTSGTQARASTRGSSGSVMSAVADLDSAEERSKMLTWVLPAPPTPRNLPFAVKHMRDTLVAWPLVRLRSFLPLW